MQWVLRQMHLADPIERGDGRVWRDYVAVNEQDAPRIAHRFAEVWRGDGVVIFLMGSPGPRWVDSLR